MKNILVALLVFATHSAIAAPVRYDYSGASFTLFSDAPEIAGSYAPGMRVTGYFILDAALAANTAGYYLIDDMLDFSFSDGRNSITASQTNLPTSIFLETNSVGEIVAWDILLNTGFSQPEPDGDEAWSIYTARSFGGGTTFSYGSIDLCTAYVGEEAPRPCFDSVKDQGSAVQATAYVNEWSSTVVPIPAAVWLFGSALSWLGGRRLLQA